MALLALVLVFSKSFMVWDAALDAYDFPAGSMGPKVEAAQDFARTTGHSAVICALPDIIAAVKGEKGTTVSVDAGQIAFG